MPAPLMAQRVLFRALWCFLARTTAVRRQNLSPNEGGPNVIAEVSGMKLLYPVPKEHKCQEKPGYKLTARKECDKKLYSIVKPLYEGGMSAPSQLHTDIHDAAFENAWKCYAQDPCFMAPAGPTEVSLSAAGGGIFSSASVSVHMKSEKCSSDIRFPDATDPETSLGPWTSNFRWYSFEEWLNALIGAVSKGVRDPSSKGRAIYVAIEVTSPGAGAAVDDRFGNFNNTLGELPHLFFKSELWSLIHVLNAFDHHNVFKGVVWLNQVGGLPPPDSSKVLPDSSAVLVPFDASYSGRQVGETVHAVLQWIGDRKVKLHAAVGIMRRDTMSGMYSKIFFGDMSAFDDPGLDTLLQDMPPGSEEDMARAVDKAVQEVVQKRVYVWSGELHEASFVSQYKLPDSESLPPVLKDLLRCALCCAGEAVLRAPYKLYKQRRPPRHECADLGADFGAPQNACKCPTSGGIFSCGA